VVAVVVVVVVAGTVVVVMVVVEEEEVVVGELTVLVTLVAVAEEEEPLVVLDVDSAAVELDRLVLTLVAVVLVVVSTAAVVELLELVVVADSVICELACAGAGAGCNSGTAPTGALRIWSLEDPVAGGCTTNGPHSLTTAACLPPLRLRLAAPQRLPLRFTIRVVGRHDWCLAECALLLRATTRAAASAWTGTARHGVMFTAMVASSTMPRHCKRHRSARPCRQGDKESSLRYQEVISSMTAGCDCRVTVALSGTAQVSLHLHRAVWTY
jgi:hypothetical protein